MQWLGFAGSTIEVKLADRKSTRYEGGYGNDRGGGGGGGFAPRGGGGGGSYGRRGTGLGSVQRRHITQSAADAVLRLLAIEATLKRTALAQHCIQYHKMSCVVGIAGEHHHGMLWLTSLKVCMDWQMIMAGEVAVAVEGVVLAVVTVAVAEGILVVAGVVAGAEVLLEDLGTGLAQAAITTALPASKSWWFMVVSAEFMQLTVSITRLMVRSSQLHKF